jgi:cell wall assembly regulator SMI1
MERLSELLERITEAHDNAETDRAAELLPPATPGSVRALGEALAIVVPSELAQIWEVYGGQAAFSPGVEGLFLQHRLFSPDECLEEYRSLEEIAEDSLPGPVAYPPTSSDGGWWVPRLLPFAGWDAYLLCVDVEDGVV